MSHGARHTISHFAAAAALFLSAVGCGGDGTDPGQLVIDPTGDPLQAHDPLVAHTDAGDELLRAVDATASLDAGSSWVVIEAVAGREAVVNTVDARWRGDDWHLVQALHHQGTSVQTQLYGVGDTMYRQLEEGGPWQEVPRSQEGQTAADAAGVLQSLRLALRVERGPVPGSYVVDAPDGEPGGGTITYQVEVRNGLVASAHGRAELEVSGVQSTVTITARYEPTDPGPIQAPVG